MTKENAKKREMQKKIMFRLEKDEDGFPPNEWESLWASKVGDDLYAIDNIPFYAREISCGDVVKAYKKDGELHFDCIVTRSLNSVLRVIIYDELAVERVRADLKGMKCESEQSHIPNLIAVEVPGNVDLDMVIRFLNEGEENDLWEYETASLRE